MGSESLSKKFCSCIKKVSKTVKRVRKDSTRESAAIAICTVKYLWYYTLALKTKVRTLKRVLTLVLDGTKAVLQTRGKTLKRFKCRGKGAFLKTRSI
jgi:hypothetical protein